MRRSTLIALLATVGAAGSLLASPQTGSGSSSSSQGGTTVTIRTRCIECNAREEARLRQKLEAKVDSIRWDFDHSKLTQAERDRLSESLGQTLQELMELELQSSKVATAVARAEAGAAASSAATARRAPMAMAYSFSTEPRGWIGVTFDAPWTEDVSRNGGRVVRFYRYPRIALVEPESPADKAGVLEGDTLLSINGDDVKESAIAFSKLLVPDNRIMLKVKREGDSKELKLVVGERPMYYAGRMTPMPAPMPGAAVRVRTPMPPMPVMPAPPAAEAPSGFVAVWGNSEGVMGARLATISEGLGKAVGVKSGVLVITAAPGTPAYRSGLRDGDVIVRASGENLTSVRDFRALVQDGEKEDGVRIVIMRDKKTKEITLRW